MEPGKALNAAPNIYSRLWQLTVIKVELGAPFCQTWSAHVAKSKTYFIDSESISNFEKRDLFEVIAERLQHCDSVAWV